MAVVNVDWKNVQAVDIFVILSSFTAPGAVKLVQVVPSNFGMERMEKEEKYGPTGLWKKSHHNQKVGDKEDENEDDDQESSNNVNSSEESEEEDTGGYEHFDNQHSQVVESDFDPEKLRAYEASKLKYYFAVAEFTTIEYANIAYREVDGLEFEHSSWGMDIRSIPPEEVKSVLGDRPICRGTTYRQTLL